MVKSASEPSAAPALSVVRGTVPPVLLIVEIGSAEWRPSTREKRLLAALEAAGLRLACALPSPDSKPKTSANAEKGKRRKDEERCRKAINPAGTRASSPMRPALPQPFFRKIDLGSRPSPELQFVELCQTLCITPLQTVLIAATPNSLPVALKAGTLLALRGAGYKNEAAADRVFKPRSEGGLEKALEYVMWHMRE